MRLAALGVTAFAVGHVLAPHSALGQAERLHGKHIAYDVNYSCADSGEVKNLIKETGSLSRILYVSRMGEVFHFFQDRSAERSGVQAGLNKGPKVNLTPTKYTSTVGGEKVAIPHRVPVTVQARFDGTTLSYTTSYDYHGTWPNGAVLTERKTSALAISLSPGLGCSVSGLSFSGRTTSGPQLLWNYTCRLTSGTCSVGEGVPPQVR